MSNFFPFGFKFGQPSGPGMPDTGCPLNDHYRWERVYGSGDSVLCWDDVQGTSVSVNGSQDLVKNLAFSGLHTVNGTISCRIAYVPAGDQNWLLPLAARMIDGANLVGARWNNGTFEVVQRRGGTWSTLWSGGAPAVGDEVSFILSSKYWKLIVNGSQIGSGNIGIAETAGYWGISQHRSGDFDGHTIFTDLSVSDASLARTPCMTANDAPYGRAEASSEFSVDYPAWKGMDCTTVNGGDCWVSASGQPMPQWIQWLAPGLFAASDQPPMIPDRLVIVARAGVSNDHNTMRGPKRITLFGTPDGVSWDEIQSWDDLDFGATKTFDTSVNGLEAYLGVRLRVDEIRETGAQCQIGTFTVFGHAGDIVQPSVFFWGEHTEHDQDAIYIRDIATGGDSDDKAQLFSGTALEFDVSREEHIPVVAPLGTSGTIIATVTTTDAVNTYLGIFGLIETVKLYFLLDVGQPRISIGEATIIADNPINDGFPHRVVCTFNESSCWIYVDSIEVASGSHDLIAPSIDMDFVIGGRNNLGTADLFFNGQISNVQVWDTTLSLEDVQYDFDNAYRGALAYERDGTSLTEANLKGHWPLIEGSGHVAFDHSGNANHGTLTGFADDDSQWQTALPSPLVPQTALMKWCIGTNILIYSDKFEDEWTTQGGSLSESGVRLDGRPAILFSEDDTDSQHRFRFLLDGFYVIGENTVRMRVKGAGKDIISVRIYNSTDSNFANAEIDLINETITFDSGEGHLIKLSDGWLEVEVKGISTVDNSYLYIGQNTSVTGINGPAFYIDGVFGNNGEIGAGVLTTDNPATNALVPLDPWQTAGKFFQGHGELNWNGKSYADIGNQADANPTTAFIIEGVSKPVKRDNISSFTLGGKAFSVYISSGGSYNLELITETESQWPSVGTMYGKFVHYCFVFSASGAFVKAYKDGLIKDDITLGDNSPILADNDNLILGGATNPDARAIGQHPIITIYKDADAQEIIDGDLDQWVADMYQKRVDQGFIPAPPPLTHNGEIVTYNTEPVYHRS